MRAYRSVAPGRGLPWQFGALSTAALLATPLGLFALVWVPDGGEALALLAGLGAFVIVPAIAAWTLTLDGRGGWTLGYAVASAGLNLALVLLELLTFGPLFAPAFVLWLGASAIGVRAQRPAALAVATAALWGIGSMMVLTALAVTIAVLFAR